MAYGKVLETFWGDPKIRGLPEEDPRWLFLYYLTSPHRNRLGLFVAHSHYVAADVQWPVERVDRARGFLEAAERIEYDPEYGVVFIPRYLKHNPLQNQKVVIGAIRNDLPSIPDTELLPKLLGALKFWKRPHYVPIIDALRNRIAYGMPYGMAYPSDRVSHTSYPTLPSSSSSSTPSTLPVNTGVENLGLGVEPSENGDTYRADERDRARDIILRDFLLGDESVHVGVRQFTITKSLEGWDRLVDGVGDRQPYDPRHLNDILENVRPCLEGDLASKPIGMGILFRRPEILEQAESRLRKDLGP